MSWLPTSGPGARLQARVRLAFAASCLVIAVLWRSTSGSPGSSRLLPR